MRDLMIYANKAMKDLDSLGIEYAKGIKWKVNKRAQKRWGRCTATVINGHLVYTIEINATLLDERVPTDGLMETIYHELCHSIPKGMCHTGKWLEAVTKINRALGTNIKRTNSSADKKIDESVRAEYFKYHFQCKNCGKITHKNRQSDFTRNPQFYGCTTCGSFKGWEQITM